MDNRNNMDNRQVVFDKLFKYKHLIYAAFIGETAFKIWINNKKNEWLKGTLEAFSNELKKVWVQHYSESRSIQLEKLISGHLQYNSLFQYFSPNAPVNKSQLQEKLLSYPWFVEWLEKNIGRLDVFFAYWDRDHPLRKKVTLFASQLNVTAKEKQEIMLRPTAKYEFAKADLLCKIYFFLSKDSGSLSSADNDISPLLKKDAKEVENFLSTKTADEVGKLLYEYMKSAIPNTSWEILVSGLKIYQQKSHADKNEVENFIEEISKFNKHSLANLPLPSKKR